MCVLPSPSPVEPPSSSHKSTHHHHHHQMLCAYGAMRTLPPELDLDALTAALFDQIETLHAPLLPGIIDALGSLNLPALPATFDQARFGEAVNAGVNRLNEHDLGMLLRGLLKMHCLPFTLDYEHLATHATQCIQRGMSNKDLVSVLLFFQQLDQPPNALCMETVGEGVSRAAATMSGTDLLRALRSLGALRVATNTRGRQGLDGEQLGRVLTQRMETMEVCVGGWVGEGRGGSWGLHVCRWYVIFMWDVCVVVHGACVVLCTYALCIPICTHQGTYTHQGIHTHRAKYTHHGTHLSCVHRHVTSYNSHLWWVAFVWVPCTRLMLAGISSSLHSVYRRWTLCTWGL